MGEFKGTPGPWVVRSQKVQSVGTEEKMTAMCYGVANANLIAAAPELLEAVRQLHDYVEDTHCESHDECESSHPMALARSAIAKALGQ